MSDWLEELERTLKAFDALPSAAQDAVNAVVESFVHDPETSQAELSHLTTLLALHGMPHSDDGRHQRQANLRRGEPSTPTASRSPSPKAARAASANCDSVTLRRWFEFEPAVSAHGGGSSFSGFTSASRSR